MCPRTRRRRDERDSTRGSATRCGWREGQMGCSGSPTPPTPRGARPLPRVQACKGNARQMRHGQAQGQFIHQCPGRTGLPCATESSARRPPEHWGCRLAPLSNRWRQARSSASQPQVALIGIDRRRIPRLGPPHPTHQLASIRTRSSGHGWRRGSVFPDTFASYHDPTSVWRRSASCGGRRFGALAGEPALLRPALIAKGCWTEAWRTPVTTFEHRTMGPFGRRDRPCETSCLLTTRMIIRASPGRGVPRPRPSRRPA